ncbi:MAG: nucleotide exchange factor GrpE [Acutalibacteraceae bacterium]
MAKKEKEVKKETEQTPEVETVSQDQFKQLQESMEALQTELEQVKKPKKKKTNRMRVLAEYDNYRKRTDREKAATYDSATADTIAQFLPVVDNMELALAQADCSAEDLRKGVQMIQKNLNDILSKMGVAVIGTVGEPINPEYQQAVSHIEDESLGENVIATVYRKGYRIGDKIVRHATVIVAN